MYISCIVIFLARGGALGCSEDRERAFEPVVMNQLLLAPLRMCRLVCAEQLPVDAGEELFEDAEAAKPSASVKTTGQIARRSHAGCP